MTLPLINLPSNVIRLVTKMMTSNELYTLSSLSKKTKEVVKPLYPKDTHVQRILNDELVLMQMISQMGYTLETLWIRLDPERITFTTPPAIVTSRFFLFKLPDKALRHVIQLMDYDELIFLSLLSKRATDIVESLNVKSTLVSVVITRFRPPFHPDCYSVPYSIISSAAEISTPFPLINLPSNAIRLVTQMMTSNELFSLWSLSKKTKKVVKPLYSRNTYVQRILNNDLVLFKMLPRQVYIEEDLNGLPETLTFTSPPPMVTSHFSLFKLPDQAIRHVIQFMNCDEIILLSFLSERSKSIAESLEIKSTFVSIDIRSKVTISISIDEKFDVKLEFSNSSTFLSPKGTWLLVTEYEKGEEDAADEDDDEEDEGEGEEVILSPKKVVNSWILNGFSIKKWLDLTKTIFHFSEVNWLDFGEGSSTFDMNDFRGVFNCQSRLGLGNNCGPEAYVMEILKTFPTAKLSLASNLFEIGKPPYEVLIQNYDYLSIWSRHQSTITLDDLLTLNSVYIEVSELSITEKDVNGFIKHWMRGSNPRIEQMYISFKNDRRVDKDLVLKKLNYVELPADQKRYFKENDEQTFIVLTVKGGSDISRFDGTKATILFEESFESLHIIVWHPHCIADKDTDRFRAHRAPFSN